MIDISEATEADADAMGAFLRELWAAAGPQAPGLTGATDEIIEEISQPEAIRSRVGGPAQRIFLARIDGEIAGFAATRHLDGDTVELSGIMVHPAHQGGVGTPLLEAATGIATDAGYRRMLVRTETDNEGALGFYERRGFTLAGRAVEQVEDTSIEIWQLEREL